jgi:hypothetical protein
MNRIVVAVAAAALLYTGGACAQTAAPTPAQTQAHAQIPAAQRVHGIVSAITDTTVTLSQKDGSSVSVDLLPGLVVSVFEPIPADRIQVGSYINTINKTQPDGSGVSEEVLVYPSDAHHVRVNGPVGSTFMTTSGVVTAVAVVDGGRRLTVDYGSGTRQITVPSTVRVSSVTPASVAEIHPGDTIYVTTRQPAGAFAGRQTIGIFRGETTK